MAAHGQPQFLLAQPRSIHLLSQAGGVCGRQSLGFGLAAHRLGAAGAAGLRCAPDVHTLRTGHRIADLLDALSLPYYLLRTTLRMFMALAASLVFSIVFAVLAT